MDEDFPLSLIDFPSLDYVDLSIKVFLMQKISKWAVFILNNYRHKIYFNNFMLDYRFQLKTT